MSLTYVTAYLNIYEETDSSPPLQRTNEWRLQHFRKLAESGILLCVYSSPDCRDMILDIAAEFPNNIRVMSSMSIEDTWAAAACLEYINTPESTGKESASESESDQTIEPNVITLPSSRNHQKDTEKYMQLQSSKMEFVQDATEKNPWNTTHFAWIDFSIAHMFRQLKKSQRQLQVLSQSDLPAKCFVIPGCWGKWDLARHNHHMDHIHWRFCGCFFLSDRDSMLRFCGEYRKRFPEFLRLTGGRLLWEVNIWAWMEHVADPEVWSPTWYEADHNDRCILLPNRFLCGPLSQCATSKTCTDYPYPNIEHFRPGSASYIFYRGEHVLNTRYVNYFFTPQAYYLYSDFSNIIKNKNVVSKLRISNEGEHGFLPLTFKEMDNTTINLPSLTPNGISQGLEDIRLYEGADDGTLRFIATSIEYSPTGRNRMIVGSYCPETATYSNCDVIIPPNPKSWCEKNWIPIRRPQAADSASSDAVSMSYEELFIYKWSPMEFGKIVEAEDGSKHLAIVDRYDTGNLPWFERFRGSTTFTETSEGLIGLVHFSEEGSPRHYYHSLLLLDRNTLHPIRYSMPFYFQKVGVEFCIGMTVQSIQEDEDTFVFWISRMDRDPLMVTVKKSEIPMTME